MLGPGRALGRMFYTSPRPLRSRTPSPNLILVTNHKVGACSHFADKETEAQR